MQRHAWSPHLGFVILGGSALAIATGALIAISPVAAFTSILAGSTCAGVLWVRRGLLGLAVMGVGATAIIGSLAIQTTVLPTQARLLDNAVLLVGVVGESCCSLVQS
jgi:hypothetical protein